MSTRFVRQSKVRHIFADVWKPEQQFSDLSLSTATGDHSYIKANTKFFAVAVRGGGGPVLVRGLDKPGKIEPSAPVLSGHKSNVFDMDFNPFHETILATGSDDSTVKIWSLPEDGLTENLAEASVDLTAHERKVIFTLFHPTAANVLATASADHTVRIWDIEAGEERLKLNDFDQLIQDVRWSYNGAMLATSCKDKQMRLYDVRAQRAVSSVEAHEGGKAFKLEFLGNTGKIVTAGFTRQSKRQLIGWDSRNLSAPLKVIDIDSAAGVIMPFYDADTNVLFLAGKGDGNVRFYEYVEEDAFVHYLSAASSTVSTKGMTMLPKRAVDVAKTEIVRFLKLTNDAVLPMSVICPRKSDSFQSDLYPPAYAGVPALTAEEWLGGKDADPVTFSLDPAEAGSSPASPAAGAGAGSASFSPMKSRAELQRELDAANERIKELEAELAKLRA